MLALLLLPILKEKRAAGQVQHITYVSSSYLFKSDISASEFKREHVLEAVSGMMVVDASVDVAQRQYQISKLLAQYAMLEIAGLIAKDSQTCLIHSLASPKSLNSLNSKSYSEQCLSWDGSDVDYSRVFFTPLLA